MTCRRVRHQPEFCHYFKGHYTRSCLFFPSRTAPVVSFVPVISVLIRMRSPLGGGDPFSHPSGSSVARPARVTDVVAGFDQGRRGRHPYQRGRDRDSVGTGSTRSLINPCGVQVTRRGHWPCETPQHCQNTRVDFRPPQGLITDGVETVPTMIW